MFLRVLRTDSEAVALAVSVVVIVIDPDTGQEASATGPLGRSVEQQLIQIAVGKLRRGIGV